MSLSYRLERADKPEVLTIADETLAYDTRQPARIAGLIARKTKGTTAFLGISYKGDLKVHNLSPALSIMLHLGRKGRDMVVHDPFYTASELKAVTGLKAIRFPEGLSRCEAVVLVPDHTVYRNVPIDRLRPHLRKTRLIVDNLGAWESHREDFEAMGISYRQVGDGRD